MGLKLYKRMLGRATCDHGQGRKRAVVKDACTEGSCASRRAPWVQRASVRQVAAAHRIGARITRCATTAQRSGHHPGHAVPPCYSPRRRVRARAATRNPGYAANKTRQPPLLGAQGTTAASTAPTISGSPNCDRLGKHDPPTTRSWPRRAR